VTGVGDVSVTNAVSSPKLTFQIVSKHSAILPAYPSYGIRANHIVSLPTIIRSFLIETGLNSNLITYRI
jgi:hypothetical protein